VTAYRHRSGHQQPHGEDRTMRPRSGHLHPCCAGRVSGRPPRRPNRNRSRTGAPDPRLREVLYERATPSSRSTATRGGRDRDRFWRPTESLAFAATGYGVGLRGGKRPEASWCIAAVPGEHVVFRQAALQRGWARTTCRSLRENGHSYSSFVFALLGTSDRREPVASGSRCTCPKPPPPMAPATPTTLLPQIRSPHGWPQLVGPTGLSTVPKVVKLGPTRWRWGKGLPTNIVPDLVFDDGRFTYLRFPGKIARFRPCSSAHPTAWRAWSTREMEGDLLRVDRVGRAVSTLRMGNQAVRIWNDAFDINGRPPAGGNDGGRRWRRRQPGKDAARDLGDPR